MLDATPDATQHYLVRAKQRALPPAVEMFVQMWGTETWATGARQITVIRKDLPPELRDSSIARRAEGWILVAAPNGALMTCYQRADAWRFIVCKGEARRPRKGRGSKPRRR
jgi:hypothetical protein